MRTAGYLYPAVLGNKKLSGTMIYARAHDQTVAEDYFAAMERVEQRLKIVPAGQRDIEVVKVQEPEQLIQLIKRLELPKLCSQDRLGIARQLRELFGNIHEQAPPEDETRRVNYNLDQEPLVFAITR